MFQRILDSQPKKILLPRFDSLGDIVLLEGFVEALQTQLPKATVTLLIRNQYSDLASLFPQSIEWLTIDINPHKQAPDPDGCRKLLAAMKNRTWDLMVATAYNRTWAEDILAWRLEGAVRLALGPWCPPPPEYRQLFLQFGLPADSCPYQDLIAVEENSQEVDKYQVLWHNLTGCVDTPEPKLFLGEEEKEAARTALAGLDLEEKRFCVCFPAGTHNTTLKSWSAEGFATVLAWLELHHGLLTLVAAHWSEATTADEVVQLSQALGAHPKMWLGRDGDIPVLAALLSFARLYYGNDTGPMHIAAALRTPVVGVFGGGTWPRFAPKGVQSVAVVGQMPCFGCNWNCIFGDAPCMTLPTAQDLKKAITILLKGSVTDENRRLQATSRVNSETWTYIEKASHTIGRMTQERLALLEAISRMETQLKVSEDDRAARLEAIQQLERLLQESEGDRAARLTAIHQLERLLRDSEADRAARLSSIGQLESSLRESESDRAARLAAVQQLERLLREAETTGSSLLSANRDLKRLLSDSEADRTKLLDRLAELESRSDVLRKQVEEMQELRQKKLFRLLSKIRLLH